MKIQKITEELSGWGRYPRIQASLFRPEQIREFVPTVATKVIARGQGRSYGDAALSSDGLVMLTERLNRFLGFDEKTGLLTAEAGTTISEVLNVFVPRGWFPSVTPGTKFVSLGGCVAADVHGKNHHRVGSFGSHVSEFEIVLADGSLKRCSPESNRDLFRVTLGGMGITGLITRITVELFPIETAYMVVQNYEAENLDAALIFLEEKAYDDQYSVAWIDCLTGGRNLGRGVVMCGHHATRSEISKNLKDPFLIKDHGRHDLYFDFPSWVLNPLVMKVYNHFYYSHQGSRKASYLVDYDQFFYPLDSIGHWNRMYGKRGFLQYQCVIPMNNGHQGLQYLLEELVKSRCSSFLAVLKKLGPAGCGLLSFPMAGYTLALDLPLNDPAVFTLLDRLDNIVLQYGGRVYLAKDARLKPETFRAMYCQFPEWQRIKREIDPQNIFCSDLSRRLEMVSNS